MGARSTALYGFSGLVLLVFGTIAWLIGGSATSLYVLVHLVLGLLLLTLYLVSGFEQLSSSIGQRSTKFGTNAAVSVVVVLGILGILNYLSARHSWRSDLTEAGVYTLSPQSKSVLEKLDKPLVIHAFLEGGHDPEVESLLDNYSSSSDKVKYVVVDPIKEPGLAEKYKIREFRTLHFQYGDQDTSITREITEEAVTNAIIKVTRGSKKAVCFLQGHGEGDPDDSEARGFAVAGEAIKNENFTIKKVVLATEDKVPEDCSVLAVIAPVKLVYEGEIQKIDGYLKDGGRALFMLAAHGQDELKKLLSNWGVKVGDGVVVERVIRLLEGPGYNFAPYVSSYDRAHPITKGLKANNLTTFPLVRPVEPDAAGKQGITAVALANTSPQSWVETDLKNPRPRFDEGTDKKGPVPIAVAVSAKLKQMGLNKDGEARLVVVGNASFADNRNISQYFNRDFFLNTIAWLGGEEDLVSIRPRTVRASRAQITPGQTRAIFYLSVLLLPEFLLLTGIGVWWRRSNR